MDRAGKDSTEGPVALAQKVLDLDSRWDQTRQGLVRVTAGSKGQDQG